MQENECKFVNYGVNAFGDLRSTNFCVCDTHSSHTLATLLPENKTKRALNHSSVVLKNDAEQDENKTGTVQRHSTKDMDDMQRANQTVNSGGGSDDGLEFHPSGTYLTIFFGILGKVLSNQLRLHLSVTKFK